MSGPSNDGKLSRRTTLDEDLDEFAELMIEKRLPRASEASFETARKGSTDSSLLGSVTHDTGAVSAPPQPRSHSHQTASTSSASPLAGRRPTPRSLSMVMANPSKWSLIV